MSRRMRMLGRYGVSLLSSAIIAGAGLVMGCDGSKPQFGPIEDGAIHSDGSALSDSGVDGGLLVDASEPSIWLDDTQSPLPERLSQVGLFPGIEAGNLERVDSRLLGYEPRWPLWSDGGAKQRHVYLPQTVDNSTRGSWQFGAGTVFFKTFFFGAGKAARPIETRVLRRTATRWDYAVYQWEPEGREAHLLDGKVDVPVTVHEDGQEFTHDIPSLLTCRACHESAPSAVLGFTELQLNHGRAGEPTLLEQLESQMKHGVPQDPDSVPAEDAQQEAVLGYLTGNCIHCHNDSGFGPNSVYDLRHPVALANLIGRPTETSATVAGIRVLPGNPDESVLVLGLLLDRTLAKPMPPVGVRRRDEAALALMRSFILSLPPTP